MLGFGDCGIFLLSQNNYAKMGGFKANFPIF